MGASPFMLPQINPGTPPPPNPGSGLSANFPALVDTRAATQQFLRKLPSRGSQLNAEYSQGVRNEAGPLATPNIGADVGVYSTTPTDNLPTIAPAPAAPVVSPAAPAAKIPVATPLKQPLTALAALPDMPTPLAGGEASTYQPKTLAGALVEQNETKRQSQLQQQDNLNSLAAYNAGTAANTAASESALRGVQGVDLQTKAEQDQRTADLQKELLDPNVTAARREQIMSAIHGYSPSSFEGFPVHDPMSGTITGMKVLDKRTGALNDPNAKAVTTADAQAAVKAGASKVEVNKRLVAAGLPPL